MVIQRWQTVFLFVATVLMALFTFMPYAEVSMNQALIEFSPADSKVYLIVNLLTVVLAFISIFMYRNLSQQKRAVKLVILLEVCSAITGGLILFGPNAPEGSVSLIFAGGVLFLVGALIFSILALRGIKKDKKTLESYDRLR